MVFLYIHNGITSMPFFGQKNSLPAAKTRKNFPLLRSLETGLIFGIRYAPFLFLVYMIFRKVQREFLFQIIDTEENENEYLLVGICTKVGRALFVTFIEIPSGKHGQVD